MYHVKYAYLSAVIQRYPHAASAVFQTYNDLLLGTVYIAPDHGTGERGPVNIYVPGTQRNGGTNWKLWIYPNVGGAAFGARDLTTWVFPRKAPPMFGSRTMC